MGGDIVGRAVNAVLIPPQAERFASLTGVDLDRLVLNVCGWNKLVLVDSERVFLFPRSADGVEWFERELAVYRALAGVQLGVLPRLLGRWEDLEIYPFPFAAVTRLHGEVPAHPEEFLEQLGQATPTPARCGPPSASGTRSACSPILVIRPPWILSPPARERPRVPRARLMGARASRPPGWRRRWAA